MQNTLFIKSFVLLVLVGVITGIGIAQYQATNPEKKLNKASKELGSYLIELQTGGIPIDGSQDPEALRNYLIDKAISDNKVPPAKEDDEGFSISLSQSFAARNITREQCMQNQNTQCTNLLTSVAKNGGQTATQKRYNEAVARTEEPPTCKEANSKFYGNDKCPAYQDGVVNCNSVFLNGSSACGGNGTSYMDRTKDYCTIPPKISSLKMFDQPLAFKDLLLGLISPNVSDLNKYEGKFSISDIQEISISNTLKSSGTRSLTPSSGKPENVLTTGVFVDSGSDKEKCAKDIKAGKSVSAACRAEFCSGALTARDYAEVNTPATQGGTSTQGKDCIEAAAGVVACVHDYQQSEQGAKDLRDTINLKPVVQAQQQAIDRCRSTTGCIGDPSCPRYSHCASLPSASSQQSGSQQQQTGGTRRR